MGDGCARANIKSMQREKDDLNCALLRYEQLLRTQMIRTSNVRRSREIAEAKLEAFKEANRVAIGWEATHKASLMANISQRSASRFVGFLCEFVPRLVADNRAKLMRQLKLKRKEECAVATVDDILY